MATAPHDKLFKETFSKPENAAVELRSVLPAELGEQVDFGSLAVVSGELIGRDLSSRHCDILYQATIAGSPGYIYLLMEHQSTVDPLMAFRILEYVVKVLSKHVASCGESLPLPVVIPVVVHHSDTGWTASTEVGELFADAIRSVPALERYLPRMSFVLDDISFARDEELMARGKMVLELIVPIVLWALRDSRDGKRLMASVKTWSKPLSELFRTEIGRDALIAVFSYLGSSKAELSREQLFSIAEQVDPEAQEVVMTFAEQCRQEGMQQGLEAGRQKGRQEGRLEGERAVLEKLLQLKFGGLDESTRARVASGTEADLVMWAERLLSASTIGDVFTE